MLIMNKNFKGVVFMIIICLSLVGRISGTRLSKQPEQNQQIKIEQSHLLLQQDKNNQKPTIMDYLMHVNGLSLDANQFKVCTKAENQLEVEVEGKTNQKLVRFDLTKLADELIKAIRQSKFNNLPEKFQKTLSNHLDEKTIICLENSNDMITLFKFKLGITSIEMLQENLISFIQKEQQALNLINQDFNLMMSHLKENQFLKFAKTLTSLIKKITFGNIENNQKKSQLQKKAVGQFQILAQNVDKLQTYYGIAVSNGMIGAISSQQPLKLSKTVLAGAYDTYGRGRVDNILQTFKLLDLQLRFSPLSKPLLPFRKKRTSNFNQKLDMKKAEFQGSYSVDSASIVYRYRALKNLPNAFHVTVEISSLTNQVLQVKNYHRIPSHMSNAQKTLQDIRNDKFIYKILQTTAQSKTGNLNVAMVSSYLIEPSSIPVLRGTQPKYIHQDWDSDMHYLSMEGIQLFKGDKFVFHVITALISTAQHSDPKNEAIRVLTKAASTNQTSLIQSHYNLWQTSWANDIVITGNDDDQKNIRIMLYHLYSFINQYKSYGISPMGLSGLGYNGHVFWDMDLWMYPAVLALNPKLAKTLVQYRFDRLTAAKNKAFTFGYKGAMFPWQSSVTGQQQCPVWAAPGMLQHHITGCVALAAWNYYCVTQDLDWLKSKGNQIIQAAAQFWESRVQKGDYEKYHIYNVVAADQWAQNVDDNAFTNAAAIMTLRAANKANALFNISINKKWQEIANNLVILKFDKNITQEHSTYHGESIKQGDVNLLAYPLKLITDNDQVQRDLEYYKTRIPDVGTPAMTYSIFTILYSRKGDKNQAYSYFKQSFIDNLLPPFNVFAQTKHGTNPYFMTGAGGVLQSMIFGFGGWDITQKGIVKIKSSLPSQWKSLTIKGFINSTSIN